MEYVMVISLGCPKNTVDSEIISATLENAGYTITTDKNKVEIIVINTCAFIEPAVEEAISVIMDSALLKKQAKLKKLIVAGCLTERYKEKILEEIPEVDFCIGIDSIAKIGILLKDHSKEVYTGTLCEVDFLNLPRNLSFDNGMAYLKISDGCDNSCTYCMIPAIRGRLRSRGIEDIIKEARWLCDEKGVKEIVLVAQDITAYGVDLYGKPNLTELLKKMLDIDNLQWIRLLYCYPELISDDLIDLIAAKTKILNYLDIPFQHASDRILKIMGRKGTVKEYTELIKKIRDKIQNVIIRTTFITGFPGESDDDFEILKTFIEESRFDRVGVFTFCDEDEAPANKLPGKVKKETADNRRGIIMEMQKKISYEKNEKRLGHVYDIIIENVADDGIFYEGRSYAEAPEIDGKVFVVSKEPLKIGSIVKVKVLDIRDYDLIGEVI